MSKLEAAFRTAPLSNETLEIYYEKLKEVDDGSFMSAVDGVIEGENFFPSIPILARYCGIEPSYDAAGRRLQPV